jgi:SAM-dependent methyltransferase
MSYIDSNKDAWEEAFDHKKPGWGDDNWQRLQNDPNSFFDPVVVRELDKVNFTGKTVAQFSCNNGRELLSVMTRGARLGIGFDIAENVLAQARETADKAGIACEFVQGDILEMPTTYNNTFDFAIITIGAMCWFRDLGAYFSVISRCMKKGGTLLIHESHPICNMLAYPGEDDYNEDDPHRFAYSYFREEPWLESGGMGYLSEQYDSAKTFASFSHKISDILNGLAKNGMILRQFDEYDYDLGLGDIHDHKGLPLSYLLLAEKK